MEYYVGVCVVKSKITVTSTLGNAEMLRGNYFGGTYSNFTIFTQLLCIEYNSTVQLDPNNNVGMPNYIALP